MSQEPSKEIKAVADSVLGAFNSKNSKLFNDSFASEVAIIDGFAPFRWTGPNAQARWWADAERWGEQLGVSSERISVEKDASLAGGRDLRLRCPFSDAHDWTDCNDSAPGDHTQVENFEVFAALIVRPVPIAHLPPSGN